jgi:hypothetical protein
VPGTTSWLLAPLRLLGLGQREQEGEPGAAGGSGKGGSAMGGSRRGGGRGGGSGGTGGGGGGTEAEAPALAAWLRGLKGAGPAVERRLASLRLHLPEWGTDAAPAAPPELAAAVGGRCDVRMAAALVALSEAAAGAPRGAALAGAEAEAARLVALRAGQLLAGFPTSADEDAALLEGGGAGGLMAEVVAFRLAKKRALAELAALPGAGAPGAAATRPARGPRV